MIVIKVNYTTDQPIIKVNYDDSPIYISTTVDATYIKVDYGTGGGSGGAIWGDIIGNLSDQLDLQAALDDKVPYTGATANVDLGEYELKAGQIELDQSPTGTAGVAVTRWNDTIGSTETTLKGGNVVLKNGVDLVARIVNKVTPNTTLTKAAYQAVRISGAQGQRLAVAFAQANNDNNSADTIGLVTETIATNQEGFIMTVGSLEGINTTGSLQGETWTDGDVLYLSPTVAGAITNVKPIAPQHLVVIGYVEYAHANNGKIYVKVMNGWELGELHDVDTTGATNGQVLKYNGSIWTPQNDLNTGTVTSVDLSAPTGFVVSGNPITSSGTLALSFASGYSLPTTIKQGNWDDAYTFVSGFPSQTGNSGKYLTTDGSTLSWGTVSTANIYNSDGTLTGNRTVTMGAFDLVLTGNSIPTLEINSTGNSVSTDYSVLKLSTTSRTWSIGTGGLTTSLNGIFYIDSGFSTPSLKINPDSSIDLLTTSTRNLTVDNAGAVVTRLTINNTGASNYSVLTLKNSGASGKSYSIAVGGNTSSVGANNLYFNYDTTDTARMTLTAAGRLLLGTTTESTYLLDVNGTGRFVNTSTSLYVQSTSSTGFSELTFLDSSGNSGGSIGFGNASAPFSNNEYFIKSYRNGSYATINISQDNGTTIRTPISINTNGTVNVSQTLSLSSSVTRMIAISGNRLTINENSTGPSAETGFVTQFASGSNIRNIFAITHTGVNTAFFGLDGTTRFVIGAESTTPIVFKNSMNYSASDILGSGTELARFSSSNNFLIGTSTDVASSIFTIASTTKGFLPPRMTAAQKTAISTPATGLVIYQTDSTEGLYQYKSTGWEAIGGGGTNIYNSDGTLTGNRTITSGGYNLTFTGSNTAASALATGIGMTHTLVAAANNDVLVGLDINPTFTNGAFTGVNNYGLRVNGTSSFFGVGSNGVSIFIANTGAIRGNATTNGTIYIDAARDATGAINLRATSIGLGADTNVSGSLTAYSLYASSNNTVASVSGTGVTSLRIGNTTSSSTWYFENNRSAPAGSLEITNSIGTAGVTIFSSRNVALGNNTDAGYKLDVQGTARVTGSAVFDANASATYSAKFIGLYLQGFTTLNSIIGFNTFYDGTNYKAVVTGHLGYIQQTSGALTYWVSNASVTAGNTGTLVKMFDFNNTESSIFASKIKSNNNTYVEYILGNDAGSNTYFHKHSYYGGGYSHYQVVRHAGTVSSVQNQISLYLNNSTTSTGSSAPTTGNVLNNTQSAIHSGFYLPTLFKDGGAITDVPVSSAAVEVISTTKGFLPPRMTETQKNAISTPATGLVIYQTDGTEGLYQYKSTGWSQVAGTGGGGGISRSVNVISTTTTAGASASTDYVYLISGTTTLTLPTAVGNTNRYTLKNVGTNTVTINTTSSQTIDGSTSITMAVRYTALDVISDGTNWNII